jgi:ATP-dependent helicase HrpB
VDLAGSVLLLHASGVSDIAAFPWFEPPTTAAIEQAEKLLRRLDALSDDGQVTELGRQLSRLPTHPRLARMLIEGARLGQPGRVALAAALLSERDPFSGLRPRGERAAGPRHWSRSDLLDRITMLEEFEDGKLRGDEANEINRHAAHFVLQARDQLAKLLERVARSPSKGDRRETLAPHLPPKTLSPSEGEEGIHDALLRAVLVAFPDRLARRREPGSPRAVMVGGKGVRLAPYSAVSESEMFVCLDVDATQSEVFVRMASAVEREWLPPENLRSDVVVEFDETAERVVARRRLMWEDLTIEGSTSALPADGQTANVLADAAAKQFGRVWPAGDRDLAGFVARVRSLRDWRPEHNLPVFDEAQLLELLPQICAGRRSFAELRQAPWIDFVQSLLTPVQRQVVEREAPERIEVPSGSKVRLQYEAGRSPVLAVRIQELFGLRETPRIAAGRVPVLLHLLAPNMRPEQVTDDLRSFWDNVYPKVRSELRRRYPRHSWPEDPWNATPQRRPGRRS